MKKIVLLPLLFGLAAAQNATTPAKPCKGQLITDAVGPVCVPKNPKRIVTIEWTYTENLLALGLQPIGAAQKEEFGQWVKTPIPLAANVKELGMRGKVNMETLAALKPDLIIDATDNNQREQLSKIAPTLTFNPYPKTGSYLREMRDTFNLMAQVTGRSTQAKTVLTSLDARVASARRQLAASGRQNETFVLSQGFGLKDPTIRLFAPHSWGSEVIEGTGLRNAWREKTDEYGFKTVSMEGLSVLNPQNFFFIAQPNDDVYNMPSQQALWKHLSFVKQGHAYRLKPDNWIFGGPFSAEQLVKNVVDAMTTKDKTP